MTIKLDRVAYIRKSRCKNTTSFREVIPTNYGISNWILTFSFPNKSTYSTTIMRRSQQQQQQQQVRSTVGRIRLTGPARPPLKAFGRLHQRRQFQRYPASEPVWPSDQQTRQIDEKAQNNVETKTKEQIRESWLQRLRPSTRAASKHNT